MMKLGVEKYHISLTDAEAALLSQIDLRDDFPPGIDAHAVYQANREPILRLLRLLVERNAIPHRRIAYWRDPELKPGRTKGSWEEQFKRNGNDGNEVYMHPSFKKFLRYFLFGAELPAGAIAEFEQEIGDPRWFSGSDIISLSKKTRELVRKYGLRHQEEEFFKLAIDAGLNNYNALSVRKAALEASRR